MLRLSNQTISNQQQSRFSIYACLWIICLTNFYFHQILLAEVDEASFVYVLPEPEPEFEPEIVIDFEADQLYKQKILRERNKQKGIEELYEEDKALYEEAFAQAPLKIKVLIEDMLKGEAYTKEYKAILLTGPSGTGKSTLAKAIAYKLQRTCRIVHAPFLLGHWRDQATENVREMFKECHTDEGKKVLIIEEINALTDGYTSEHGDTKHTAMQLWTSLDSLEHNDNFFLIGTTNITNKMPHQLQSRFEGQTFFIDHPTAEARKRTLVFCINNLGITRGVIRDATCTDAYLTELAQKTDHFSMRSIQKLVRRALLLFSIENRNVPIKKLSKKYLDQAYVEQLEERKKLWDFTDPVTDEERRHQENMNLQIKLSLLSLMTREGTHMSEVEKWTKIMFPKRKLDWKWEKKGFTSRIVSNDE